MAPVVTFNLADWKPTPTCQSALSFTQLSHLGAPPQLAVGAHCCIGLYPGSTAINLSSRDSDLEFDLGHSLLVRSHKTMVFQRSLFRAPIRSWRRPKRYCTDPTERFRAYNSYLVAQLAIAFPKRSSRRPLAKTSWSALLLNPKDPGWESSTLVQQSILDQAQANDWSRQSWPSSLSLCQKDENNPQAPRPEI